MRSSPSVSPAAATRTSSPPPRHWGRRYEERTFNPPLEGGSKREALRGGVHRAHCRHTPPRNLFAALTNCRPSLKGRVGMSRIAHTFAALKKQNRAAFVPFITAGDPDFDTALALLSALPRVGADIIELGIPFSDPMADGPVNQASYLRALASGMTLVRVLDMVRRFRGTDGKTPVVLMGAFNPIHAYGTARFAKDAAEAGIDGLLIVDLPPEEDEVLRAPATAHGLAVVRFVTPTT